MLPLLTLLLGIICYAVIMVTVSKTRCAWACSDELLMKYHDKEWGVSVHDDRRLFEILNLEGAQAGLNWLTILKKRGNYRVAFDNFDAAKIAAYNDKKRAALLNDAGIIRNRLKINAFIENAKAYLKVREEYGSFDAYAWGFLSKSSSNGSKVVSITMSKDMKKRGFRFVGPTTCYSFMEATGMINNHEKDCFLA